MLQALAGFGCALNMVQVVNLLVLMASRPAFKIIAQFVHYFERCGAALQQTTKAVSTPWLCALGLSDNKPNLLLVFTTPCIGVLGSPA
jgi:hypothetical protein